MTPLSGRPGQQYLLALILIGIGIVLFFLTMADQPSARHPRRRHHRPDASGRRAGLAPAALRIVGQLELRLSRVALRVAARRSVMSVSVGCTGRRRRSGTRSRGSVGVTM